MGKFIFIFLFLIIALDSYCQENKSISSTKVILSNHQNTIRNNDTITGPGFRMLTISLASDSYQLIEAEYSIILKRGKANAYSMSGKGKEISLVDIAAHAQPKDIMIIEIKKLKISTPGILLKPSNGFYRIYLK
jgi:hypothetical protein